MPHVVKSVQTVLVVTVTIMRLQRVTQKNITILVSEDHGWQSRVGAKQFVNFRLITIKKREGRFSVSQSWTLYDSGITAIDFNQTQP